MPRATPVSAAVPVKYILLHVSLALDPPKMEDKQEALLVDSAPPSFAMTKEDKMDFQRWKAQQEEAQKTFEE